MRGVGSHTLATIVEDANDPSKQSITSTIAFYNATKQAGTWDRTKTSRVKRT